MKEWILFLGCLALLACALNTAVPYVPNPNVNDPAKVIERIMISQLPDFAGAVPYKASVKNDSIEMWMTGPGSGGSPGGNYYRGIGKVVLNYTNYWYVAILDRPGIGMYKVSFF